MEASRALTICYVQHVDQLDDGIMPLERLAERMVGACSSEIRQVTAAYGSRNEQLDLIFAEAVARGHRERRFEPLSTETMPVLRPDKQF
jgi:hypothetical protein